MKTSNTIYGRLVSGEGRDKNRPYLRDMLLGLGVSYAAMLRAYLDESGNERIFTVAGYIAVSYTHLTLPTICSV